jgi:hypothetical protein
VAAARRIVLLLGASLLVLSACGGGPSRRHDTASVATPAPRHVPRLIVDTDLGLWWDDAAALGVVNVLARRGAVQLLAVVSDVPDRLAVAAIDAIDIYYGNADVPVGAVAGSSADTAAHGYVDALVERLPHSVRSSSDAPAAVRRTWRVVRSRSSTPSSASSWATDLETACWARCSRCAARVKLRSSATATNVRSWRRSGTARTHNHRW